MTTRFLLAGIRHLAGLGPLEVLKEQISDDECRGVRALATISAGLAPGCRCSRSALTDPCSWHAAAAPDLCGNCPEERRSRVVGSLQRQAAAVVDLRRILDNMAAAFDLSDGELSVVATAAASVGSAASDRLVESLRRAGLHGLADSVIDQ